MAQSPGDDTHAVVTWPKRGVRALTTVSVVPLCRWVVGLAIDWRSNKDVGKSESKTPTPCKQNIKFQDKREDEHEGHRNDNII